MHVVHCTTRPKSMLLSICHAMNPGIVLAQKGTFCKGHHASSQRCGSGVVAPTIPQHCSHTQLQPLPPHTSSFSWYSSPLCAVDCCPPFEAQAKDTFHQVLCVFFLETVPPPLTPPLLTHLFFLGNGLSSVHSRGLAEVTVTFPTPPTP